METNSVMRWTDLRGIAVVILGEGKKVGDVDDFYFKPEANSIYALRIKTGIFGHRALTANAISSIGHDAIVIANENMVIDEAHDGQLSQLPRATDLQNYKVMSESGTLVGNIGNILIETNPPTALHIVGYEMAGNLRDRITGRYSSFSANEITSYGKDVVIIIDQAAKGLK